MVFAENVEYGFSGAKKIVGNDPPMAPPPNGFSTHYRSASSVTAISELGQAVPEFLGHCIISVVSEAGIVPVEVGRNIYFRGPLSQSAKRSNVGVPNLNFSQVVGQCFSVELGIGARARYMAHINYKLDLQGVKQIHELRQSSR